MTMARTAEGREIGFATAPALEESLYSCWNFSVLEICADLRGDRVVVKVKLAGQVVARATLSAGAPKLDVDVNLMLAKLDAEIRADFSRAELRVRGDVCVANFPSGWSCDEFDRIILSW